jgi:prophage regulatory protein
MKITLCTCALDGKKSSRLLTPVNDTCNVRLGGGGHVQRRERKLAAVLGGDDDEKRPVPEARPAPTLVCTVAGDLPVRPGCVSVHRDDDRLPRPAEHGPAVAGHRAQELALVTRRLRLMRIYEIKQRLGVKRQRADQLTRRPGFPEPVDTLKSGRVWLEDEVEAWIREHRTNLPNQPPVA